MKKTASAGLAMMLGLTLLYSSAAGAGGVSVSRQPAETEGSSSALDRALASTVSVDATGVALEKVLSELAKQSGGNVVVNWRALGAAGVGRETPVTLHLQKISMEAAVQALVLSVPTALQGTRLNYAAGDNALEVSTDTAMSFPAQPQVYALTALLGKSPSSSDAEAAARWAAEVVKRRLQVGGDDQGASHLAAREGFLMVTTGPRGQAIVAAAVAAMTHPMKVGEAPPAARLTPAQQTAMKNFDALFADPKNTLSLNRLALDPSAAKGMNIVLFPGAAEAKDALNYYVNAEGIVEIGTNAQLAIHTMLGAYDMGALVKRIQHRSTEVPSVGDEVVASRMMAVLRTRMHVPSEEVEGEGVMMWRSGAVVVVIGMPAKQRAVAAELARVYK